MQKSSIRREEALVRGSDEKQCPAKAGNDQRIEHRGGVLQSTEQRPEGYADSAEAVKFLACFARAMIRNNPSSDTLFLSMLAASKEANISSEQAEKFIKWVMAEQSASPWPKGFF